MVMSARPYFKLTHDVLGVKNGEVLVETYRCCLSISLHVDLIDSAIKVNILNLFGEELKQYCEHKQLSNKENIADLIVEEIRTYHYL
jgi:hypothetical protein